MVVRIKLRNGSEIGPYRLTALNLDENVIEFTTVEPSTADLWYDLRLIESIHLVRSEEPVT